MPPPGGGWGGAADVGCGPVADCGCRLRPPSPTLGFARAGGTPIALGAPPRPLRHWGRHDCPQDGGGRGCPQTAGWPSLRTQALRRQARGRLPPSAFVYVSSPAAPSQVTVRDFPSTDVTVPFVRSPSPVGHFRARVASPSPSPLTVPLHTVPPVAKRAASSPLTINTTALPSAVVSQLPWRSPAGAPSEPPVPPVPPPESAVRVTDGVGVPAESSEPPSPPHAVSVSAPASPTAASAHRARRERPPRARAGPKCSTEASVVTAGPSLTPARAAGRPLPANRNRPASGQGWVTDLAPSPPGRPEHLTARPPEGHRREHKRARVRL